jgi:hypothetical protein
MKSSNDLLRDPSARASVDSVERLGALTRVLSFARNEACELEADVVAYCLDVALAAVLDSLKEHRAMSAADGDEQDGEAVVRRH